MPDFDSSTHELLAKILSVLERIDNKIALKDEQIHRLSNLICGREAAQETPLTGTVANSTYISDFRGPSRSDPPVWHDSTIEVRKVSYKDWDFDQLSGVQDAKQLELLQNYLGDWWKIPVDHRLALSFSRRHRERIVNELVSPVNDALPSFLDRYSVERLKEACSFDAELRTCPGNDFLVVDFDHHNNHMLYRVGEVAIGSDLILENAEDSLNAPWSRLM